MQDDRNRRQSIMTHIYSKATIWDEDSLSNMAMLLLAAANQHFARFVAEALAIDTAHVVNESVITDAENGIMDHIAQSMQ